MIFFYYIYILILLKLLTTIYIYYTVHNYTMYKMHCSFMTTTSVNYVSALSLIYKSRFLTSN